jgi:hypothetical protein
MKPMTPPLRTPTPGVVGLAKSRLGEGQAMLESPIGIEPMTYSVPPS